MRGGGEKGIGRETSSKAKKNVVRERERERERGRKKWEEDDRKRREESEIHSVEEMRKILGDEEAK